MRKHLITAALVGALVTGGAAAQVLRTPQTANVAIAPATAADIAAISVRIQQLELAHSGTRTELAQARIELAATRTRLDAALSALRAYGNCGAQSAPATGGNLPPQTTEQAEQALVNAPMDIPNGGSRSSCRALLTALR